MITNQNLDSSGLDDWVNEFYDIYKINDKKRTVTDMWLNLVEDSSKVAEALRKDEFGDAYDALAHVFCWLFSFIAKCQDKEPDNNIAKVFFIDKKFSEIVWYEFPQVCWKCHSSSCLCPIRKYEIESETDKEVNDGELSKRREQKYQIPPTLDQWVIMFERIYGNTNYASPIERIGFHFMEEIGEVAKAIRNLSRYENKNLDELEPNEKKEVRKLVNNLESEAADVFSWSSSLIIKLRFMTHVLGKYYESYTSEGHHLEEIRLSKILWNEYKNAEGTGLHCPTCGNRPCTCPVH